MTRTHPDYNRLLAEFIRDHCAGRDYDSCSACDYYQAGGCGHERHPKYLEEGEGEGGE